MISDDQRDKITELVNSSLDRAEKHWRDGGHKLVGEAYAMDSLDESIAYNQSYIPGHPMVSDSETVIDEFIAYVADMRGSTERLMCAISKKHASVSGLQRVFYETSALLPALALTVDFGGGKVTEYLGDGVLALFKVDSEERSVAIYAANKAANDSIGGTRDVVNRILADRYRLPGIDLGVGLAHSRALVSLVGVPGNKHPKAFGECVFRATKLSCGKNEVVIDESLKMLWPKSKSGVISFRPRSHNNVNGFLLTRKSK